MHTDIVALFPVYYNFSPFTLSEPIILSNKSVLVFLLKPFPFNLQSLIGVAITWMYSYFLESKQLTGSYTTEENDLLF